MKQSSFMKHKMEMDDLRYYMDIFPSNNGWFGGISQEKQTLRS